MPESTEIPVKPLITEAQYLELERKAERRSEFYQGEIFAMSGGSLEHTMIISNLSGEFHAFLKGKPCKGLSQDLRLHIHENGLYTYPDFMVICGKPEMADATYMDTLLNPTLIIEVLSPSTESYDRGRKFGLYRSIPSLKEYGLISQDRYSVDKYFKNEDGNWEFNGATGPDHEPIHFRSLDFYLSMADIYAGIDLPA